VEAGLCQSIGPGRKPQGYACNRRKNVDIPTNNIQYKQEQQMQRRRFLTQAAAAAGAGLAAASLPAAAQGTPSVRWRMSTGWPKSLDEMYGSAEELCQRVSELTEGKFEIRPFPGGELVPYA